MRAKAVDLASYRVALPRPFTRTGPDGAKQVEWTFNLADVERDDQGRITRIAVAGRVYSFTLDPEGGIIDVQVAGPTS